MKAEPQDDPVIITVAPIGAEVTRLDHPGLPHSPAETVAAALEAVAAGASVVHLHARLPDGKPSAEPSLFVEMVSGIRSQSDALIMTSTGGAVWMSIDERIASLDARPDMCSLETGSMNFGDDLFITSRPDCIRAAKKARELGIVPEIELFDVGHSVAAVRLLREGHLDAPLNVNLVLGVPGGIDPAPEAIEALLRPLPEGTRWCVTAVGRSQRRMLALAVLLGANGIRVGFEDNVYLRKGRLAASNAELVSDAVSLVRTLGRDVASCTEARRGLGVLAAKRSATGLGTEGAS